jgi:catalase
MSIDLKAPSEAARPRLGKVSTLTRFGLIGVALAAVVGTFAYFGGWFSPNELTPGRFTDGFEQVNGVHPGFRRNHAKGVGVSGVFESNGNGVRLSKASVFQSGSVPVIGRFSLSGGQPYAADAPKTARGLGLEFSLPNGEEWRTAMINLPVFPVGAPEAFYELLIASKPDPITGKPDQAKMAAFRDRHPEFVKAQEFIQREPPSSGFENSTFRGLHAFRFINAAGDSTPVRWELRPEPVKPAGAASAAHDKNYLFEGLIAAFHREKKLRWDLIVIIGQPGDPTNDASVPWREGREQVNVGTLTLDHVESDDSSAARDINFDPLVLPAGIAPSDDPLLSTRSAVYSRSFTRRAGETKQPSAITPADVHKGE